MSENTSTRISGEELPRRAGEVRQFARDISVPIADGNYGMRPDGTVHVTGTLTQVDDGIYADLNVRGDSIGECVRCLDTVRDEIDEAVRELFVEPSVKAAALADGDEEAADWYTIEREGIDLSGALIDLVLGGLDDRPLCRPDCPGLCDQCGEALADGEEHDHLVIDSRWAQLLALKNGATDDGEATR